MVASNASIHCLQMPTNTSQLTNQILPRMQQREHGKQQASLSNHGSQVLACSFYQQGTPTPAQATSQHTSRSFKHPCSLILSTHPAMHLSEHVHSNGQWKTLPHAVGLSMVFNRSATQSRCCLAYVRKIHHLWKQRVWSCSFASQTHSPRHV